MSFLRLFNLFEVNQVVVILGTSQCLFYIQTPTFQNSPYSGAFLELSIFEMDRFFLDTTLILLRWL